MRARLFSYRTIVRAAGFALVVAAIVAAGVHLVQDGKNVRGLSLGPASLTGPLARELPRCQSINMVAMNDTACDAAWAVNHYRIFRYRAPDRAKSAPSADRPDKSKSQDR